MTSNVNFWINIPSLKNNFSTSKENSVNGSDFASYLLNTSTTLNNSNTSNSVSSLFPELAYKHSDLFSTLYGQSTISKTPTMSDYLQNTFQAQQLKTLATAKDKLQAEMSSFATTINEKNSLAEQHKLLTMKNNIAALNIFLNNATAKQNYLNLQASSTSAGNGLLPWMSASSALSQYLLLKNS
ncbi:hypothetical protein ACIQXF_06095 [Lysinibacillus sp. NPDC097231]|uniref:hypothetical protein n=1 Tax=Lysinibacillus sp. NPDC097231 TaxID=3364142 RepID=UPI0038118C6E